MNKKYIIPVCLFFFACSSEETITPEKKAIEPIEEVAEVQEQNVLLPEFQAIIDSAHVDGSILIYDLKKDTYYSNNYETSKVGHLPASTFKITNSIIALETGIVANDSTIFKWDGKSRRLSDWEQDLTLHDAFHFSCVPCYQEIARNIGLKRMTEELEKLSYENMQVDSSNLDLFWLEGTSKISPFEQIDFLKKLYESELPISERTEKIMKRMMVIEERENFKLTGKTGWSITNEMDNGWFVGYVETNDNTYFIATNISPKSTGHMDNFANIRKDVGFKALAYLGVK
jgi:beta-lactamase class D